MSRQPNRRPEPGAATTGWALALAVLLLALGVLLAAWAAAALAGPGPAPPDPVTYALQLAAGQATWPARATPVLVVLLAVVALLAAVLAWSLRRLSTRRTRVDAKASSMATGRDLAEMTGEGARRDAARLGAGHAGPGVPVAASVRTGRPLLASWEWVQVHVMGPRAGKTSCVCVRQVLETQGPVLATSNKRDLVDLTRGPRSEVGAVWVNDPQQLAGEPPDWWWDPLSYVTGVAEADRLAGLFAAAARRPGDRGDAYFDTEGRSHLSGLLLAAASAGRPLPQVWSWLTTPDDLEPVELLRAAGHTAQADAAYGITRLHPKQRDGVVGTARSMTSFLRNQALLSWVAPTGPGDTRPQFDPDRFVASRETIYLLSREGDGSARALTAALTVAVVTAAERLAARQPGGRLSTPLTCVLDEAANVCRWPELPDLYSHYGSRGIVMSTFLQGWSQGVEVWGREGMEKLWTAANVRVAGPGIAETDFLDRLSRLVGDHDVLTRDVSTSRGRRSTSARLRRERILEVADLAALPRGRAVMLASGTPAALLKLTHWSATPYADQVRASQAHYGAPTPGEHAPAAVATAPARTASP